MSNLKRTTRNSVKDQFLDIHDLDCTEGVDSKKLTTMGIGGEIVTFLQPHSLNALKETLSRCTTLGVQTKILGKGSNVLFPDEALSENAVITLGRMPKYYLPVMSDHDTLLEGMIPKSPSLEEVMESIQPGDQLEIYVSASSGLMKVCRELCNLGLSGLEFAAGIPASIGGALKMNAGAHGAAIGDIVSKVFVVNTAGEVYWKSNIQMKYRDGGFGADEIILGGVLTFQKAEAEEVKKKRVNALNYRKRTQPLSMPSCGSVFRNPSMTSDPHAHNMGADMPAAAQLLEKLGFKGKSIGDVRFSDMHSNWIVRTGASASSSAVKDLVSQAQEAVKKEFGIALVREIVYW